MPAVNYEKRVFGEYFKARRPLHGGKAAQNGVLSDAEAVCFVQNIDGFERYRRIF
jgi:hypothetical protein